MILTLTALVFYCSLSSGEVHVPHPENVRIKSHDMNLILEWDPPQNSTERNFTYTAEYKAWKTFTTVCQNDSMPRCNFSDHLTCFAVYTFRVRTDLDGRNSDWIKTELVSLDQITVISAPEVKLQSRKGDIEVDITDPVLEKIDLRDLYYPVLYYIQYWIEGEEKKELKVELSKVMLPSLTPNVQYCVQVEIILNYNKTSLPSNVTCVLNTESEDVQPWVIVVVLLVSFVVVLVSVVFIFFAVWYIYRAIKYLNPEADLPEHFKQNFLNSILSSQPEECYHEVRIIPRVEEHAEPQDLHQKEIPNCNRLSTNVSSKHEEDVSQEEKLRGHEQRKDCKNVERDVNKSYNGETDLLLQ